MIVFDCQPMKSPDNGLYFYCYQLGKALLTEAGSDLREQLAFYIREQHAGCFGEQEK